MPRTKEGSRKPGGNGTLTTRLLDGVSQCFTPAVAKRIVKLRADAQTLARVEELAGKCNEGELTSAERAEYDSYVSTSTFIAILQAKSRALLAQADKTS